MPSVKSFPVPELEEVERSGLTKEELDKNSEIFDRIQADFESIGCSVSKVERLKNFNTWQKYKDAKRQMENRVPQAAGFKVNETYLYHGTKATMEVICQEGFDENLASKGNFGRGIYFSDTPEKCKKYAKHSFMLLSRVLLGETKVYEDNVKDKRQLREPEKPEPFEGHKYYDSIKGRPKDLTEYVIYRNQHALIEYVIHYNSVHFSPKPSISSIEPPALVECSGSMEGVTVDKLNEQSVIFRQIKHDFHTAGLKVINVERLNNASTANKYIKTKDAISNNRGGDFAMNETYLYFGTNQEKDRICQEDFGLEDKLKTAGNFGKAFYFSDTPKRFQGDSFIFVVRVILGDSKVYEDGASDKNLKKEPEKKKGETGWRFYDSVKGQPEDHPEFAIYRKHALIDYVVTFDRRPGGQGDGSGVDQQQTGDVSGDDSSSDNDFLTGDEGSSDDDSDGSTSGEDDDLDIDKPFIPYFELPEGELDQEGKMREMRRITKEGEDGQLERMLVKTGGDLERAIYLYYAYKLAAKEGVQTILYKGPVKDDGKPIFPVMNPLYNSAAWNKLSEGVRKTRLDEQRLQFMDILCLHSDHANAATKYLTSAKYNLDTAVVAFFQAMIG